MIFPIIGHADVQEIVGCLEYYGGVFIEHPILAGLGQRVFTSAHKLFESGKELPSLDEKTMFPNTINTLPGASRRVIQRYITRPFPLQEEPLHTLTEFLSSEMEKLSERILAEARNVFGWNDQTITDLAAKDEWVLNIANYPFTEERDNQLLFPAHKDWGLMAIYPYVDGPGLEVYAFTDWLPVEVPEGCMFCYAGDIFTRITDSKISALLHRVTQPSGLRGSRTSVIFYADPHREMVLPDGKTVGSIIDSKLRKIGQIT